MSRPVPSRSLEKEPRRRHWLCGTSVESDPRSLRPVRGGVHWYLIHNSRQARAAQSRACWQKVAQPEFCLPGAPAALAWSRTRCLSWPAVASPPWRWRCGGERGAGSARVLFCLCLRAPAFHPPWWPVLVTNVYISRLQRNRLLHRTTLFACRLLAAIATAAAAPGGLGPAKEIPAIPNAWTRYAVPPEPRESWARWLSGRAASAALRLAAEPRPFWPCAVSPRLLWSVREIHVACETQVKVCNRSVWGRVSMDEGVAAQPCPRAPPARSNAAIDTSVLVGQHVFVREAAGRAHRAGARCPPFCNAPRVPPARPQTPLPPVLKRKVRRSRWASVAC